MFSSRKKRGVHRYYEKGFAQRNHANLDYEEETINRKS
jgi:hypothetical protein